MKRSSSLLLFSLMMVLLGTIPLFPTVRAASDDFYIWGSGGDGYVYYGGGTFYNYNADWLRIGLTSTQEYYGWLSFYIGTTFSDPAVVQSIDSTYLYLKCESKDGLEDADGLTFKEFDTDVDCGFGGDSSCDSAPEIYNFAKSGSISKTVGDWNVGGWTYVDYTGRLAIGDSGYFNAWIEESGFSGVEIIDFYSVDSAYDPYLRISYTLVTGESDEATLHVSMFAPDGVGLRWESFKVYLNDTRVPYPPAHLCARGYYTYEVKDYFNQVVRSGSFNIGSNVNVTFQNWLIPVYEATIPNRYNVGISLEITHGTVTAYYSVSAGGSLLTHFYGTSSNINYRVVVKRSSDQNVMERTYLEMPDHAITFSLGSDRDDTVPCNLQLATHSSDPVSVWTVNQLSGQTHEYQATAGNLVNLDLSLSNFDLLDHFEDDGLVAFKDSFEDGDAINDPTWTIIGDSFPTISSVSAYGSYSMEITTNGSNDGFYQAGFSSEATYLVIVFKTEGVQPVDEYFSIDFVAWTPTEVMAISFVNQGITTGSHYTLQVNEGEWYVFCLNIEEMWDETFDRPFVDIDQWRIFQVRPTASASATYLDLVAWTNDPSLLLGSQYQLHSFTQGQKDYALSELGDPWDFQEDMDGFIVHTIHDPYVTNGYITFHNISQTWIDFYITTNIDTSEYTFLRVRARVNDTTDNARISPQVAGVVMGASTSWDNSNEWQIFDWDLSQDSDWTGIKPSINVRIFFTSPTVNHQVDTDYIMLMTCDPSDFTQYQSTTIDLLDGSQQVTVFPKRQLTIDSGLADTTRAIVTNAVGSSTEYTIGDSSLSVDLVYNNFESFGTTFDTDESENWVESTSGDWSITNGYYSYEGTHGDWTYAYYKDLQIEDGEIIFNVLQSGGSYGIFGAMWRVQDLRNYYWIYVEGLTNKIVLCRKVDGSTTYIAIGSVTITNNVVYEVKVRYYDSYIEIYVDETLIISVSDSTFLSAGYVGLGCFSNTPSKFFDFKATSLPDSQRYTVLGLEADTKEYFYDELGGLADWQGGTMDGWTVELGSNDWFTDKEVIQDDSDSASYLRHTGLSIDASEYHYLYVRSKANTTAVTGVWDSGTIVGANRDLTTTYAVHSWDLGDDADWTGTETWLQISYLTAPLQAWTDFVLLLSDEDYFYKDILLNQDRSIHLFKFATVTVQLTAAIPSTGSEGDPISVFGTVLYSNGSSVLSGTVTVYWGTGEGSSTPSITDGRYSAPHTYATSGDYDIEVNFLNQWQNGTVWIDPDPTAPTKTFEIDPPSVVELGVEFTVVGYAYWSNGSVWHCGNVYVSWEGEEYSAESSDGYFSAHHSYDSEGLKTMSFYPTGHTELKRNITITVTEDPTETIQLTGFIPSIGSEGDPIGVFGTLLYSNGTSASGTVTVYWGTGEGSSTPSIADGRYSAPHTYATSGYYDIEINFESQWQNGTVWIDPDPTAPTLRVELSIPNEPISLNKTFTIVGLLFWSNGTSITSTGNAITVNFNDGTTKNIDAADGVFYANHSYTTAGIKTLQATYDTKSVSAQVSIIDDTPTKQLNAHIPNTGLPTKPITVYGSLLWSNGTSASGIIIIYWGVGEGSDSVVLQDGRFAKSHTYNAEDTFMIAVNWGNQWQNGSIGIHLVKDPPAGVGLISADIWSQIIPIAGVLLLAQAVGIWQLRKRTRKPKGPKPYKKPNAKGESERIRKEAMEVR